MKPYTAYPFDGIVDAAYVLTCTKFLKNRIPLMQRELDFAGISDITTNIIQFPSPFEKFVTNRVPHIDEIEKPGRANLWFAHYRAMKTGFDSGANVILVMEDDIRFLRDRDAMKRAIDELPGKFYIALLDPICDIASQRRDAKQNGERDQVPHWGISNGGIDVHSAGCYMMDRDGMHDMIAMYESVIDENNRFRMMRAADHWWNDVLHKQHKLYLSMPNLAVQETKFTDRKCTGMYTSGARKSYTSMGLDLSNYGG